VNSSYKFFQLFLLSLPMGCGDSSDTRLEATRNFVSKNNLDGSFELLDLSCSSKDRSLLQASSLGHLDIDGENASLRIWSDKCQFEIHYRIEEITDHQAKARYIEQIRTSACGSKFFSSKALDLEYTHNQQIFRLQVKDIGCYAFRKE